MRKLLDLFYKIKKFYKINKTIKFGSIWNFIHGFSMETIRLNGITKKNYKSFISDRQYWWGHPYNGGYSSIIDNKLYLPYLLKDYPEHAPIYYYYLDSKILGLCGANKSVIEFETFLELLNEKKKLVLKHVCSSLGQGFHLLEYQDKGYYLLDKLPINIVEIKKFIYSLRDYIVSEYVKQHQYAEEINSSSLNTIRMLCVWDEDINSFYIARCFHRFGSNGSLVDNLGGGDACLQFVDIETGIVESAGMTNKNNQGEEYFDHVIHQSGKDLTGLKIPDFIKVKNKIIEISNSFPFLKYIGWDIAITKDGFKIIEANSLTSLGILQRKGGYLDNPNLRKIFKV